MNYSGVLGSLIMNQNSERIILYIKDAARISTLTKWRDNEAKTQERISVSVEIEQWEWGLDIKIIPSSTRLKEKASKTEKFAFEKLWTHFIPDRILELAQLLYCV